MTNPELADDIMNYILKRREASQGTVSIPELAQNLKIHTDIISDVFLMKLKSFIRIGSTQLNRDTGEAMQVLKSVKVTFLKSVSG